MDESVNGSIDVKMDIQKELMSIHAVVNKIKQELSEINEITRSDGTLDTALEFAIDTLETLASEKHVAVKNVPNEMDDNSLINSTSGITTKYITEKMRSLIHK